MIDLTIYPAQLEKTVLRCHERNILIPTFEQMKHPEKIPQHVIYELQNIGLWDLHPRNLFRVTWKNEPVEKGGAFGDVNYLELPESLTGVKARIIALVGKWFPTGAHKVGASFGCLAPRLLTGQFDPSSQKAVWPSTGNYCRGGAYVSALLACESIAILPEEMSRERFEWLENVSGEVIATPGCESNVKEIFDKCWELRKNRGDDVVIFNQFDEFGNHLWHYEVTGNALLELLQQKMGKTERFAGFISATGSAGTLAAGDFLKKHYPELKIAASEALQCPTMLNNGFGGHRIEGIGDKHIPWIHNVRNTDMAIAVDDEVTMRLIRLFNEADGKERLIQDGVPEKLVNQLELLGISSVGNLIAAIKFAKYYELTEKDIVATIFTDSMELYDSRLKELNAQKGAYNNEQAMRDTELIHAIQIDNMQELGYYDRKRIHNLKYYTWIEQQAKDLDELNAQWYDYENYWGNLQSMAGEIDRLIEDFNKKTGL
ncbi:MAG TPA: pyridoxal-phosphate dependent enzyme [Candidatus Marinimicrobia bacterium]|nr:pyridoxal-phosphate dependent enzyme [Candidatus Neomarinimicrobiota bacterium]